MQNPEIITVLSALIAGAVSLIAITLSKEQKVSEFRQVWIDGLRSELATFLSSSRAFARMLEAEHSKTPREIPFSQEKKSELRLATVESVYRIKLRLNPNEKAHTELIRLLEVVVSKQNGAVSAKNENLSDVLTAVDALSDQAGTVLKGEWKRVKKGELPFRVIRIISVAIVLGAVAFFGILAWYGE